jgi:serine/threonine protein phosphatase PrpC
MALHLDTFGATHAGKVRKNNEDSLLVGEGRDRSLFAVADGIGGFEAGEVASSIAVDVLKDLAPSDSLEEAIREANRRILESARSDEKLSGMGTTVVAARFRSAGGSSSDEPLAEVSHVGDSRAYLLRGGEMKPVTEDHSLVAELVRSGDLTRAEASEHPQRNLITRALGAEEVVAVDTAVLPVEVGDRLLLCSDGLSDMVPEATIGEILSSANDPEGGARALVSAALDGGGADNITVVVIDVREEPAEEPPPPARSDTQELRAAPLVEDDAVPMPETRAPARDGATGRGLRGKKRDRARKQRSLVARALAALVRWTAALVVLAALATPFYLWANSQYYLGFDGGVVVIYRGLPPEYTLGFPLYEEHQRTDLRESQVDELYRGQIVEHELKSLEEAERVVRDLRAEEDPPERP